MEDAAWPESEELLRRFRECNLALVGLWRIIENMEPGVETATKLQEAPSSLPGYPPTARC